MRAFLREPAPIIAAVAAFIQVLVVFNFPGLNDVTAAATIALVTAAAGLVTAASVAKDKLLPAIVGFAQSGLALAVAYGAALSDTQLSTLMAFVTVAAGLFVRTQVIAKVGRDESRVNSDANVTHRI